MNVYASGPRIEATKFGSKSLTRNPGWRHSKQFSIVFLSNKHTHFQINTRSKVLRKLRCLSINYSYYKLLTKWHSMCVLCFNSKQLIARVSSKRFRAFSSIRLHSQTVKLLRFQTLKHWNRNCVQSNVVFSPNLIFA